MAAVAFSLAFKGNTPIEPKTGASGLGPTNTASAAICFVCDAVLSYDRTYTAITVVCFMNSYGQRCVRSARVVVRVENNGGVKIIVMPFGTAEQ